MPKRDEKLIVLWPHYFDQRRSRAGGRRVSKELAVERPDAKWVEAAAKKAGYTVRLEEDAKHPGIPWKVVGRVLVENGASKETVLKDVATEMQG